MDLSTLGTTNSTAHATSATGKIVVGRSDVTDNSTQDAFPLDANALSGNPVDGVEAANGNESSTPALGDAQARKLLEAPPADTLKGRARSLHPGKIALDVRLPHRPLSRR